VPKPIKILEGIRNRGNGAYYKAVRYCERMINISYFYGLLRYMGNRGGQPPVDLYLMPMLARTALPPNANFGLSDWS